nr:hypothetical protein [Chaetopeltis orbicularis]
MLPSPNNNYEKIAFLLAESLLNYYNSLLIKSMTESTWVKINDLIRPNLIEFFIWTFEQENSFLLFSNSEMELIFSKNYITEMKVNNFLSKYGWINISKKTYEELYLLFCKSYVRSLEANGNFIKTAARKQSGEDKLFQKHHIVPKFMGGSDDSNNLISCTIYLHGLAHLLRFLFTRVPQDIAGVNNSLRTVEEITAANNARTEGRRAATPEGVPIGRPFQPGQKPKQPKFQSELAKAHQRIQGTRQQKVNNFIRSSPLTRFVASLIMYWSFTEDKQKELKHTIYLGDDVGNHLAVNVGEQLFEIPTSLKLNVDPKSSSGFSAVMRGDANLKHGWRLPFVALPSEPDVLLNLKEVLTQYKYIFELVKNKKEYPTLSEYLSSFPNSSKYFYEYCFNYFKKEDEHLKKLKQI